MIRETVSSQQLILKPIWTLSQRGIPGTKLADLAAKEAAKRQPAQLGPTPVSSLIDTPENMSPKIGIHIGKTCQKTTNPDISKQHQALGGHQCHSVGS